MLLLKVITEKWSQTYMTTNFGFWLLFNCPQGHGPFPSCASHHPQLLLLHRWLDALKQVAAQIHGHHLSGWEKNCI